jgi:hypothetical protein
VVVDEVESDGESEVDDALDHDLSGLAVRLERHLEIVRADEGVPDPVRLADERHHELVLGLLVDLPGRADLLDPALAHHRDLVGDLHRLLLVVRDDHRRRVRLVVEAAEPFPELGPHAGVQRAERLVEEEDGGIDRERPREPHPLALPARELRRVPLRETLELDELQELSHAICDLALRSLADLQAERDVVVHRHVLERRVVLEHEPDAPLLRGPSGHVRSVDRDAPRVRRLEPGDDPQQRGLAAAAGAEERGQGPGGDLDRHVVEREELVESLGDATDGDRHQCFAPFGWTTIIVTRTRIAIAASTNEMPYAGA